MINFYLATMSDCRGTIKGKAITLAKLERWIARQILHGYELIKVERV